MYKVLSILFVFFIIVLLLLLQPSKPVAIKVCGFEKEQAELEKKYSRDKPLTTEEFNEMNEAMKNFNDRRIKSLMDNECYEVIE